MKTVIFSFFFLSVFTIANAQKPIIREDKIKKKNYEELNFCYDGFKVFDKNVMYPNGNEGVLNHIVKTIKYPKKAKRNKIEGVVIVDFLVDIDGKAKDIKVVQSAGKELDEEAIRIIRKMDRWIPAIQNGKYIKTRHQQAISFIISDLSSALHHPRQIFDTYPNIGNA